VRVETVEGGTADPIQVGSNLQIKARVNLGGLSADDIEVQLFHGLVDSFGEIPSPRTTPMNHNGPPTKPGEPWIFEGAIPCRSSGQHGYAVRVVPRHTDLANSFEPGLICWG
jgi:starch phosphorylase